MLKSEAVKFLMGQGLTRRQAKTLLEDGCNADVHPDIGLWRIQPIPGEKGNPLGVYLACVDDAVRNQSTGKSVSNDTPDRELISAAKQQASGRNQRRSSQVMARVK